MMVEESYSLDFYADNPPYYTNKKFSWKIKGVDLDAETQKILTLFHDNGNKFRAVWIVKKTYLVGFKTQTETKRMPQNLVNSYNNALRNSGSL